MESKPNPLFPPTPSPTPPSVNHQPDTPESLQTLLCIRIAIRFYFQPPARETTSIIQYAIARWREKSENEKCFRLAFPLVSSLINEVPAHWNQRSIFYSRLVKNESLFRLYGSRNCSCLEYVQQYCQTKIIKMMIVDANNANELIKTVRDELIS